MKEKCENSYKIVNRYETGITSEVLTIKSNIKVVNIINNIIEKKSLAILKWIKSIENNDNVKIKNIIIVGAYLTGIGISKLLSKSYNDITIIDIYPHIQKLVSNYKIDFKEDNYYKSKQGIGNQIKFSTNINLIKNTDLVIDTTGLGGLGLKESIMANGIAFLIENPIAEDNDITLREKNNIYSRINETSAKYKAILKTKGLNTKTSGTMTFTIDVLMKTLQSCLEKEGVLYCIGEIRFFEEIIFKEKNIEKFLELINNPAITSSTLIPFDIDEIILDQLNAINSSVHPIE